MKQQNLVTPATPIEKLRTVLAGSCAVTGIVLALLLFGAYCGLEHIPSIRDGQPIRSLTIRAGRYYKELRLIYRVNVEPDEGRRNLCDSEAAI